MPIDPPLLPNELTALLGRGTRFEGKLHFEGAVRIDGAFRGEIRSDDVLVIGDGAEVEGEIDVAVVIVRGGTVRANIRARRSIELGVAAKVTGSLHAPEVVLEKGVQFEGSLRMAPMDDPERGGLGAVLRQLHRDRTFTPPRPASAGGLEYVCFRGTVGSPACEPRPRSQASSLELFAYRLQARRLQGLEGEAREGWTAPRPPLTRGIDPWLPRSSARSPLPSSRCRWASPR